MSERFRDFLSKAVELVLILHNNYIKRKIEIAVLEILAKDRNWVWMQKIKSARIANTLH